MAVKGFHCNKKCSECKEDCDLFDSIPCGPSCDNLTEDGKIKIAECLKSGCEEVKCIFDMVGKTDQEVIDTYGEVAPYPYDV